MISRRSTKAAEDIYRKYSRYLGADNMGNQDKECCIQTIAEIISYHHDKEPDYLTEALNTGDGVYRP